MSDPVYIGYYTLDDATSMPNDARFLMYDPAGPGSYNITGSVLKAQILASPVVTGQITIPAGTAALPALTTAGDFNTGVHFPADDTVAIATGGSDAFTVGLETGIPVIRYKGYPFIFGSTTDASDKRAYIVSNQYNSSAEPEGFFVIGGYGYNGGNQVAIGGLASAYNAATTITFTTASDTVTRTGTERMRITSGGKMLLGRTANSNGLADHEISNTLAVTNTSALTSAIAGVIWAKHKSTGNMVDGFGSGCVFSIEDTAGVHNNIAHIMGIRSGADDSGSLAFTTYNAGSGVEKARINPSGQLLVGMSSTSDTANQFQMNGSFVSKHLGLKATTADTGASSNLYYKLATVTINAQYSDFGMSFISENKNTTGAILQKPSVIRFRAKQQAAFGSNPIMEMTHECLANNSLPAVFGYVITSNAGPTTIDIYAKIVLTNTQLAINQIAGNAGSASITWQGFTIAGSATEPSGWVAANKLSVVYQNDDGKVQIGGTTAASYQTYINNVNEFDTSLFVTQTSSTTKTAYNTQLNSTFTESDDTTVNPVNMYIGQRVVVPNTVTKTGGYHSGILCNNLRNFKYVVAGGDSGTSYEIKGMLVQAGHYNSNAGETPSTTLVRGLHVIPYAMTGTISNMYGLFIGRQNGTATVTNKWGVYQEDSSYKNYFAGSLLVGTPTDPGYGAKIHSTAGISLGNTAVANGNVLDWYEEGTFTATATGMTTSPTGAVKYTRNGNIVVLDLPAITGTSNATTFTLTGMPSQLIPAAVKTVLMLVADNSGVAVYGKGSIGTDGILTIYKGPNGDAFTASGVKTVWAFSISYTLQ